MEINAASIRNSDATPGGVAGSVLAAARRGDQAAWATIYGELAPPVLGYLRANAAPEPEDTLSEVFLQVARDLPRFTGEPRRFRAWVFTIAHHRMIDARRRSARRPAVPVPEPPEADTQPLNDAADLALAKMGTERVTRVLRALSRDQRAVLLLRLLGGLTVEEAAQTLGKRPGAVKALQRRGLNAIRRRLSKGA